MLAGAGAASRVLLKGGLLGGPGGRHHVHVGAAAAHGHASLPLVSGTSGLIRLWDLPTHSCGPKELSAQLELSPFLHTLVHLRSWAGHNNRNASLGVKG